LVAGLEQKAIDVGGGTRLLNTMAGQVLTHYLDQLFGVSHHSNYPNGPQPNNC
jgi:hypothetical protein